ncbi:hypothetical protein ACFVJH_33830 [Streptomyces decoyicus]|uniref:hypothetical protein n=1 Tax=Streptomyces decoyicus TaxID=249567 RepID=UPI0036251B9E
MAIHTRSADALLSYALKPDPDPLNASTDKDVTVARLNLTVGRDMTAPAYCRKITVKIPIGAGGTDLTAKIDGITQGVTGGTAPEQGAGWTAGAPTTVGNKRVFTFTPGRVPQFTGQWAITIGISQIEINKTAGKVAIEVIEESSPTNSSFTEKTTTIAVDKFPPGFLLRNFRPDKIMVDNGEHVTLTWEVQNATCILYWDNNSAPVNTEPKWKSPEPLHNTTGFMLQATSTTDSSLVHTLTTAVTVAKPDLEVGHLNVYGKAVTHDGLTVDGVLTAEAIHALGELKAESGLTTGSILASDGPLDIHGAAITHGRLETRNGLSLGGPSTLMTWQSVSAPTGATPKTAQVPTDGILSARVTRGRLEASIKTSGGGQAAAKHASADTGVLTAPLIQGGQVVLRWTDAGGGDAYIEWFSFGGANLSWS